MISYGHLTCYFLFFRSKSGRQPHADFLGSNRHILPVKLSALSLFPGDWPYSALICLISEAVASEGTHSERERGRRRVEKKNSSSSRTTESLYSLPQSYTTTCCTVWSCCTQSTTNHLARSCTIRSEHTDGCGRLSSFSRPRASTFIRTEYHLLSNQYHQFCSGYLTVFFSAIMSVAHLQIKDGPLFNGTPFGFTDEPVSGEIGKLFGIIFCNWM